ncbi:MAG: glutamate--cysteine ligase, partial [Polaromonas sp.]
IGRHAESVGASASIHLLRSSVERNDNDARWLRDKQNEERLLAEVIRQAAERFRGGLDHLHEP